MSLAEFIVEKRTNYLRTKKKEIIESLTTDPGEDLGKLFLSPGKDFVLDFLEKSRNMSYFKSLYDMIKDREFSWNTLKGLEEVSNIQVNRTDSVMGCLDVVSKQVDRILGDFLEPASSFPLFYADKENGIAPNCLGSAQIVAALYGFKGNLQDLSFSEIYDTLLRDRAVRDIKKVEKEYKNGRDDDFVVVNLEQFTGGFYLKDLKEMLIDSALSMEEAYHAVIRNRNGDFYDNELERESIVRSESFSLEDGIHMASFGNLCHLYHRLDLPLDSATGYYKGLMEKKPQFLNSESFVNVGILLKIFNRNDGLKRICDLYGGRVPARWRVSRILSDMCMDRGSQQIRDDLNALQEFYHPSSLDVISKRYTDNTTFLREMVQVVSLK